MGIVDIIIYKGKYKLTFINKFIKIMKLQKGFTLIELLVVIAIIGILSSVVLASLNTARTKGRSAAVKSALAQLRSQMELYYDSQTVATYGVVDDVSCDGTTTLADTAARSILGNARVNAGADGSCQSNGTEWAVSFPDPAGPSGATFYCVDSTGVSRNIAANLASSDETCN